jgi:hypothetical protein
MGRSTFEGPVLAGDQRFGPFRNVGYMDLVQNTGMSIAQTTPNTALYGGSAGIYVKSNGIPNAAATVYTPNSGSTTLTATSIPADSATVYRGAVMYIPAGSKIIDILVDVGLVTTFTSGTLTSIQILVGNNYTAAAGTGTYGQTAVLTSPAVGRQSLAAFTAGQYTSQQSTSTDIVQDNGQPNLSQIVFTVASINGTNVAITGGIYYFTLRYIQPDGNIGTTTTYPYGNLD